MLINGELGIGNGQEFRSFFEFLNYDNPFRIAIVIKPKKPLTFAPLPITNLPNNFSLFSADPNYDIIFEILDRCLGWDNEKMDLEKNT